MENNLFPRINGPSFPTYLGRNVILIGEVLSAAGGNIHTVKLSDGTEISASLPLGERVESRFVQLTGKIVSPSQVEVRVVHSIGDSFDTETYNGAVDLILGKYKYLFM